MNEEQVRRLRSWRTTSIVIAVIEAGLLIAHSLASASWPGTRILGVLTLAWTAFAVRNTLKLRAVTAAQPRVDWQWIRIMEHEVYGRIFHHDGAPGISGTAAGEPAPPPGDGDLLLILSGAIVSPGGSITLPSGAVIDSAEWARRGGRTS